MQTFHSLVILTAFCGADLQQSNRMRFDASQPHMGAVFEIVLYAPNSATAEAAFASAFARIAELDDILSDYDPDSELSRLSKSAPTVAPVAISDDLLRLLQRAVSLSRCSDGAFDVTIGPLSRLWRRARRQRQLPGAERLEQARAAVGYRHMRLDAVHGTAQLLQPRMRLDLGGIAKGYAADAALAALHRAGIERALVNAGGDIATSGTPPDKLGWRVGIAPLQAKAGPSRFVLLAGSAVATSGDAWQFVEINGRRYSHIIDPQTGMGLTRRSSVTVIAADGTTADGLASAVSVLGPHKGIALVEQTPGAAALIVQVEGDQKPRVYESARFQQQTHGAGR